MDYKNKDYDGHWYHAIHPSIPFASSPSSDQLPPDVKEPHGLPFTEDTKAGDANFCVVFNGFSIGGGEDSNDGSAIC